MRTGLGRERDNGIRVAGWRRPPVTKVFCGGGVAGRSACSAYTASAQLGLRKRGVPCLIDVPRAVLERISRWSQDRRYTYFPVDKTLVSVVWGRASCPPLLTPGSDGAKLSKRSMLGFARPVPWPGILQPSLKIKVFTPPKTPPPKATLPVWHCTATPPLTLGRPASTDALPTFTSSGPLNFLDPCGSIPPPSQCPRASVYSIEANNTVRRTYP